MNPDIFQSPPRDHSLSSQSDFSSPPDLSWTYSSPSPSGTRLSSGSGSSKRGRPKSENLTSLIIEGKESPSTIKCKYCGRVFPRDKSLNAHERIHTGQRPYVCDFPGCTRAFTQSGQLKTHQRLHTGEKPFKCSVAECQMRFTHANRHCTNHPYSTLIRCEDSSLDHLYTTEQNAEVLKWLERYRANRDDKTPKRRKLDHNDENSSSQPTTPTPFSGNLIPKSRKGLMCELDMNAGLGTSPTSSKSHPAKTIRWQDVETEDEETTTSPINPKKRWLRDAWQEDLARPLDPIAPPPPKFVMEANQNRPTVLMLAKRDQALPLE